MRLHRFYIEEKLAGKSEIKIFDEAILHQMKNVFRLEKGDKVIFFDGGGVDFECVAEIVSKKEGLFIVGKMIETSKIEKEVHVFLACIRKERFEWTVEKCTEIGVASITPIITERSERTSLNIERLRKIAVEASEQCGRGNIPDISEITDYELAITNAVENQSRIIVADFGGAKISDLLSSHSPLRTHHFSLFIGPEGGFTNSEREFFKKAGVTFISLGPTTLRAETAAVVGCSLLI